MVNLKGKVCLVTGGTSGIGLVTAKEFARMGATTIVTYRDDKRGKAALADIIQYSKNNDVHLLRCDFSSQASIQSFCELVNKKFHRLDRLVNNAGLMSPKRIETDLGIELTFAVNHLGYFITTNLLLDLITSTAESRIINVASDLHFSGSIDLNDLNHNHHYHGFSAYCDSKLANVLFTYQLAKVIQKTRTTANTLHPGVIKTKFSIEDRNSTMTFPMGQISPEEGAKAQLYLSTSPDLQTVSGRYFNQMRMERSSVASYDEALADQLWQKSVDFMNMKIGTPAN